MGMILFFISSIIRLVITPFIWLYTWTRISKGNFQKCNRDMAVANDQFGNVLFQVVFNDLLITKEGYKFGKVKETISSVVGKNKINGTLTSNGELFDMYLTMVFGKDHSISSIDNSVK